MDVCVCVGGGMSSDFTTLRLKEIGGGGVVRKVYCFNRYSDVQHFNPKFSM